MGQAEPLDMVDRLNQMRAEERADRDAAVRNEFEQFERMMQALEAGRSAG